MKIRQRRILIKIHRLHQRLLSTLPLDDKKHNLLQSIYSDYHNSANVEILKLELSGKKSK